MANAVLALAEPYRTTVLLRFWEGLSPAAIAKQQGVPTETVRTRLKRGLMQLRARLDDEHGGDRKAWLLPLTGIAYPSTLAASVASGILLMHTTHKLLVAGVVAAALSWMMIAPPWSAGDAPSPPTTSNENAVVVAAAGGLADSEPNTPARQVPEARIDNTPAALPAKLEVVGVLVDGQTGTPLANNPVTLIGWPINVGVIASATTDEAGRFIVQEAGDGPAPGNGRRIVARVVGRSTARVHVPLASPQEHAASTRRVDLGDVRVFVGTRYSGTVVRVDGTPISGAKLWLPVANVSYSSNGPSLMLDRAEQIGTTDVHGRFVLEERLVPDIRHRGLLFAVSEEGVGWCEVEPSKQARIVDDLIVRLRPKVILRVRVQTEQGAAVGGATVRALPRFSPIGIDRREFRMSVSRHQDIATHFAAVTNEHGDAVLPALPIGVRKPWHDNKLTERTYDLCVEVDGYGKQPLVGLDLVAVEEQQVVVTMLPTKDVTLDVFVRDARGAAIPGANVQVVGHATASDQTDALGVARIAVTAIDKVVVHATRDGYRGQDLAINLVAGEHPGPVHVTLRRTRVLEGRVVDQFGEPAANMSIFVGNRMMATTGADGGFQIGDFPAGEHKITVALPVGADPSHWSGKQMPTMVDASQGPARIVLERRAKGAAVHADVVDALTGQSLELAAVGLWLYAPEVEAFAIAGQVQHEGGVVTTESTSPGRWRLDVRAVSGQRGSREFTIRAGQVPAKMRLELPGTGTITGQLQFVGVDPPKDVTVSVRFAKVKPGAFVQYHFPGVWHPTAQQTLDRFKQLLLDPAQSTAFQLDLADTTQDLVFTVHGKDLKGVATVRAKVGQTTSFTLEVRRN